MKKINACINQKDRIVCEAILGALVFYYQPAGTKDRVQLFKTDAFSGSVWAYFRDHGRNMNDRGISITIKQLYMFKEYRNAKLAHIINRIPAQVEYVIREHIGSVDHEKAVSTCNPMATRYTIVDNREYAA